MFFTSYIENECSKFHPQKTFKFNIFSHEGLLFSRFLLRSSVLGGYHVIRKEAGPFCRTSSSVRLWWEPEEPKGPKLAPDRQVRGVGDSRGPHRIAPRDDAGQGGVVCARRRLHLQPLRHRQRSPRLSILTPTVEAARSDIPISVYINRK